MKQLEKELERDPRLRVLKARIDGQVLAFLREHAIPIVEQARADTESEVPSVPMFDEYLRSLEETLRTELGKIGYFNGVSGRMIRGYRDQFYHSSLPNLMAHVPDEY